MPSFICSLNLYLGGANASNTTHQLPLFLQCGFAGAFIAVERILLRLTNRELDYVYLLILTTSANNLFLGFFPGSNFTFHVLWYLYYDANSFILNGMLIGNHIWDVGFILERDYVYMVVIR